MSDPKRNYASVIRGYFTYALAVIFVLASASPAHAISPKEFNRIARKAKCDTAVIGGHSVEHLRYRETTNEGGDGKIIVRFEHDYWRIDAKSIYESHRYLSSDPRCCNANLQAQSPQLVVLPDSSIAFFCLDYESPFSYGLNGGTSLQSLRILRHATKTCDTLFVAQHCDGYSSQTYVQVQQRTVFGDSVDQDLPSFELTSTNKGQNLTLLYYTIDTTSSKGRSLKGARRKIIRREHYKLVPLTHGYRYELVKN